MANIQKLNNVDHQNLRVKTGYGAEFGDDVMFAMTFPGEMRAIQAHYPILIYKDPNSGKLAPVALLGFERGENLFLKDGDWDAAYVPAMIRRQPFMVGQESSTGGERQRVVAIDVEHPRVNTDEGELLFLPQGGTTEYLEQTASMLEGLFHAQAASEAFMQALSERGLIQSVTLNIRLKDGSEYALEDFYTIDDEALQKADEQVLAELSQDGWLLPAYMMLASLSQLQSLIGRRNQRL
ncbi:SapC family protein [Aequoribacter sp.]|uniref:SapC family protein n=1 Tax=Aequoribacter sp. TaxID=2847771 RepID=UPI003F6A43C2